MSSYYKFLLASLFVAFPFLTFAQSAEGNNEVFQKVDQMPEFQGDLNLYLPSNIKYPAQARREGIEGRVVVSFVVDENGKITNVKVIRGIRGGCDEEAKRVVEEMPDWKPGKLNGKAVKVGYTLPVRFQLSSAKGSANVEQSAEKFTYVEQMPAFKGDFNAFLSQNIHYPPKALKKGIEGRVIVSFVVDEDGSISDVQLMHGIGGGCDEEAIRVVKGMPAWKPGKQNGKPVKVRYTLPIRFVVPQKTDDK